MARTYFTNCEHGICIPISLTPRGEYKLMRGDYGPPLYEFLHEGNSIMVFKTDFLKEKIHILRGGHKVTDPEEATKIALEIPVEALNPRTAGFDGERGNYRIDLRKRKRPKILELPVYSDRENNIFVRQHLVSQKLTIYRRAIEKNKRGKEKIRLKSVTSGKEAREILRKAEKSKYFATYFL